MKTWRQLFTRSKQGGRVLAPALMALALVSAAVCVPLVTRATNIRAFAVGNRTFGATNGWTVVPAVGDSVAILQTLSVTTDQAPGRIVVYSNSPPSIVLVDHPLTSSNIMVDASSYNTNGMAAGDQLLAHVGNTPNDRYDRLRIVSVSTTNILIAVTSSVPLTAGTRLYRVSTNQVITGVTNGPTSIYNSQCIAAGEVGQPMLIDIIGSSSLGQILGAGGIYLKANP